MAFLKRAGYLRSPFIFHPRLHSLLLPLLLIKIKLTFSQFAVPQKMIIDKDLENTDPITGFMNPFRKSKLDSDAIVIQRRNQATTTYHLLDDANGHPIFTRPLKDRGKKFIFFNNPSFPQGSGHYIVLRKMELQNRKKGFNPAPNSMQGGNQVNAQPQFLYETFSLSFKDTLIGTVTDLDPLEYKIVKTRSGLRQRLRPNIRRLLRGGGGGRAKSRRLLRRLARGKREIHDYEEQAIICDFDSLFVNSTSYYNPWTKYGLWNNLRRRRNYLKLGEYLS